MDNFDILYNGDRVGVVRIGNDDKPCTIRDLHIEQAYQGWRIGSVVVK